MLMQAELVWLLGAVAKGDTAAFERLYGATRAKLYGVLLRILGKPELAEEVMQETYLKVWKMADKFDPTLASPITWMVAMARNRAIDIVRKRSEISIEDEPEAQNVRRRDAGAAGAPRDDRGAQATACPASASSIRKSSASCCSPITAAGAAISCRPSSIFR